jgi:hypothetical protein
MRFVSVIGLAMVSVVAACGGADKREGEGDVGEAHSSLAKPAGINLWPNGIVPICWDNTAAGHPRFAELSARFLEILNDHYSRAANIQFEDAGRCPASPKGVIRVTETESTGNNVWPLGYFSNAVTPANFNWNAPSTWFTGTQATIQQVVMHEFAHALGFEHEFLRPDWTTAGLDAVCNGPGADLANGWNSYGTTPDSRSITASTYCNNFWTTLSAGDVSGLQSAYGAPGFYRIDAASTDGGLDLMYHWWNGTWNWGEVFPDIDNISTRLELTSLRVGGNEHIRAFSLVGSNVNQEFWNGSGWSRQRWTDKNVDLPPAAVAYRDYGTGVNGSYAESKGKWYAFTRDSSANTGNLVALHYNGSSWSWNDYGKPYAGGNVQDVDAVAFSDWGSQNAWIYAFVKAPNGEIYARYGNPSPSAWSGSLGKPGAGSAGPITVTTARQCLSGGCATDVPRAIHVWTVANGTLWNLFWNGSAWVWGNLGKPAGVTLAAVKPSVVHWTTMGQIRYDAFVLDTFSNLHELYWNGAGWVWNPNGAHGKPAQVTTLSAPSAVTARIPTLPANGIDATITANPRYVFVVGNDNKAYVRWTMDGTNWAWQDQTTPFGNIPVLQSRGISAIAYWGR